jgi:hypothetical protein
MCQVRAWLVRVGPFPECVCIFLNDNNTAELTCCMTPCQDADLGSPTRASAVWLDARCLNVWSM